MVEESATSSFEVVPPFPETNCELAPEPAAHSPELRSKSAAAIAKGYNVLDITVQLWFKAIAAACCWLEPEALKTGKSAKTRYKNSS